MILDSIHLTIGFWYIATLYFVPALGFIALAIIATFK